MLGFTPYILDVLDFSKNTLHFADFTISKISRCATNGLLLKKSEKLQLSKHASVCLEQCHNRSCNQSNSKESCSSLQMVL